jgi:hypothetical protein
MMSSKGEELRGRARQLLLELGELEKTAPHDVNLITIALVAHIRTWKPAALSSLAEIADAKP